ncbi:MAG: class I SAM-dependent methyltransferase [Actinomycetota bacterium]|nr:class I SAM-dependent methyltransferase [Actinomycetota bacterium]
MAARDLTRGLTFDGAALVYDQFRPRYPRELFDDLAGRAAINATSRILEVGCGPGVATEEMISRGWSVLGVDPGEQLARVAREKFGEERFAVEVSTFEDWRAHGRRFDVVFSASAFHWVAPEIRWTKAAAVLADGGFIALAGNKALAEGSFHDFSVATRDERIVHGVDDERDSPDIADLRYIIRDAAHDIGALWEAMSPQGTTVVAGELFDAPEVALYPWTRAYSTPEALGLVGTYSRFLVMDDLKRTALFERLKEIIDRDYGGELTRHYVSVLATARRDHSG